MEPMMIDLSNNPKRSLQDAVQSAPEHAIIKLAARVYSEHLVINKSLTFVGNDSSIHLDNQVIGIEGDIEVVFEHITFQVRPTDYDANIMVTGSKLILKEVTLNTERQIKDFYAAIWVEGGSLVIESGRIDVKSNLVKAINGTTLSISNASVDFKGSIIAMESRGMHQLILKDNKIHTYCNMLSATKIQDLEISNNTITVSEETNASMVTLFHLETLDHGDQFEIQHNEFSINMNALLTTNNCLVTNRELLYSHNTFNVKLQVMCTIDFRRLQGNLTLEENQLTGCTLQFDRCEALTLQKSQVTGLTASHVKLMRLHNNTINGQMTLNHITHLQMEQNKINNSQYDAEALRLVAVDKVKLIKNRFSSVDHGLTLLNAGDNLECMIKNNEFINCRKRAINIASTQQQKYFKTELHLEENLFINNEKAIYVDDQNLKSIDISKNYFGENKDAVMVYGGKGTSKVAISHNYLSDDTQHIEVRTSQLCVVANNELNDGKMNIRGCDEIRIVGNHMANNYLARGKALHNEIAIKTGGSLTVSQNVMLTEKMKYEKKEVMAQLNVTAYERHPAIAIYDNYPMEGSIKRGFFDTREIEIERTYPDASLKTAIRFEMDTDVAIKAANLDEAMKTEFVNLQEQLVRFHDQSIDLELKKQLENILKNFKIDLFAERETNDIYRFIVKTTETVEMLKLYFGVQQNLDEKVSKRIKNILKHYETALLSFSNAQQEEEQDQLSAQIKLLENLL